MIGELIDGKYRILRQLGQGGMGAVYEAEHVGTGGRVAIKVLTGADLVPNGVAAQRFQREVRAAGGLDTKHVVRVLDAGVVPDRGPYMVMEILRGEDLAQMLKRLGPLPTDLALRIVGQACLGLLKAHEAGIVHRDIKPANLFLARVDEDVIVKVLDFGIAKVGPGADAEAPAALTKTGLIMGSIEYMSPEQIKSTKSVDHRTDIWSLGVVLYEALAGRGPFAGHDSVPELLFTICTTHAPPIQDVAPWVPPEVTKIVQGTLVHDARQRIQTVSALLDAIRPLVPQGLSLRQEMLVPLAPEQRGGGTLPMVPRHATVELPTQPMVASDGPSSAAARNDGAAPSHVQPPGRKASLAAALAVIAVLTLGGTGVALYELGQRASREGAPATSTSPSGPPATPPVAATTPAERTVRVMIEPASAVVDVDDVPSEVRDGAVEVRGALGSVHRLHLRQGQSSATTQVVIAESGPLPPKVQLEVEPSKVPPKAKESPVAPAPPSAPRAPSPAPKMASTPPPAVPAATKPRDEAARTFQ